MAVPVHQLALSHGPQPQRVVGRAHRAEKTFSIGGNNLWAFSTALRLLWMAEHEPRSSSAPTSGFLIEDFLNFMLCGRQATDYTHGLLHAAVRPEDPTWSDEMLGPVRHRRPSALRSGSQRHVLGEVTRGRGRGHGAARRHARWCSAATTTSAARSRSAHLARRIPRRERDLGGGAGDNRGGRS